MNQIFSPSRFVKYVAYQYRIRGKIILLTVGGASVFLTLVMLYSVIKYSFWNEQHWMQLFFIVGIIGAVLYAGSSFPFLRKQESTYNYLMLPVSVFEKYIYEYLSRVVLYMFFYTVLFYLLSNITISFVQFIFPSRTFFRFSLDIISSSMVRNYDKYQALFLMFVLMISIFFAGAVIVRKHPILKTLVAIGLFFVSIYGFLYVMIDWMGLNYGLDIVNDRFIKSDFNEVPMWVFVAEIICSLIIYVYAYYKLKEKEV